MTGKINKTREYLLINEDNEIIADFRLSSTRNFIKPKLEKIHGKLKKVMRGDLEIIKLIESKGRKN